MAVQVPTDFRRVIVAASVGNIIDGMTSISSGAWLRFCPSSSSSNHTRLRRC